MHYFIASWLFSHRDIDEWLFSMRSLCYLSLSVYAVLLFRIFNSSLDYVLDTDLIKAFAAHA